MSLFRWSRRHDVFLPELDAEHRALFLAGDKVHCALLAGAGADTLREEVNNLLQLVEAHFLHEERLMRDSDFESFEWHRKQHDTVRKKARRLKPEDPAAVGEALEFIAGWLGEHTSVADRIMAAHIRNWTRRVAA